MINFDFFLLKYRGRLFSLVKAKNMVEKGI
jgi:hypothetical protein